MKLNRITAKVEIKRLGSEVPNYYELHYGVDKLSILAKDFGPNGGLNSAVQLGDSNDPEKMFEDAEHTLLKLLEAVKELREKTSDKLGN